jgi:hypothetical protein
MAPNVQNPAAANGRVCEVTSLGWDDSQHTRTRAEAQYQLIGRVRKNAREEFRIAIRQFKNFRGVDLRVFALNGEGDFIETPRAIAMRLDAIPQIVDALLLAARMAEARNDATPGSSYATGHCASPSPSSKGQDNGCCRG